MKSIATFTALLVATAQAYSAHTGKDAIDQNASTKEHGLVLWEYFFDSYVDAKNVIVVANGFSSDNHLCKYDFVVEKWDATNDSRYALSMVHNCKKAYIETINFVVTWASAQNSANNSMVYYTANTSGSVSTDTGANGTVSF